MVAVGSNISMCHISSAALTGDPQMSQEAIYVYIAEGGALFVCNAIFGTATVFVMRRRSAFVLIGAMLAADAIYGLSFLLTGIHWAMVYGTNQTGSHSFSGLKTNVT
jgi:hypothetical protein